MKIFIKTLPFLLAAVFVASGITKIISIDFFEQFLYSFGVLKLNHAIILARLIVGLEFTLGVLFALRIFTKPLSYITLALLTVFTAFIIYLEISKSSDDCYCFGTLIQLSNTVSIIKNVVLAALVVGVLKTQTESKLRYQNIMLSGAILLGFGFSFGVYFPDTALFNVKREINYCQPCFNQIVTANKLTNKKLIICFFSTKCKYCQLSTKKMTVLAQKANNHEDILYILWDKDNDVNKFFSETKSYPFTHMEMDMFKFMNLTTGKMPLIILYNKGKVEKTFRYKDLDEDAVLDFLQTKQ